MIKIQKCWTTYFKNDKTENELIKDFSAILLKILIVTSKKIRSKVVIIHKEGSGRKSNLPKEIKQK